MTDQDISFIKSILLKIQDKQDTTNVNIAVLQRDVETLKQGMQRMDEHEENCEARIAFKAEDIQLTRNKAKADLWKLRVAIFGSLIAIVVAVWEKAAAVLGFK